MMPSCLFVDDFAPKSVPKIGRRAPFLVQFVTYSNTMPYLQKRGQREVFSTGIPLSILTTFDGGQWRSSKIVGWL
jgi:hypothetical protein